MAKVCGFGEVKLKEGLVYDKHGCRIIGFEDLGAINNQLLMFEQELQSGDVLPKIAKHMLVFMVRGIYFSMKFPYAQYATSSASADVLYPLMWEVIRSLEYAGFKVISITCDKAASNRKLFKMHSLEKGSFTYKVRNPYSEDKRDIFFFSDVPHLIKTVRNCWSNSFSHSNKRPLWVS